MSGFNSGAIDPALLSGAGSGSGAGGGGGGAISPAQLLNNRASQAPASSSAAAPSSTAPHHPASAALPSPATSNANLYTPTPLNQSSSNFSGGPSNTFSSHIQQPPASSPALPAQAPPSSATLLNGSAQPHAPPAVTSDPFMANGISLKEHEMHQKDQEMAQFLLKMDEYKPVIPDEVAAYYLQRVGFECADVRVRRLLVLACQKFVSDIAQDAFSYARTRTGQAPGGRQGPLVPNANSAGLANGAPAATSTRKDRTRTVLTQEDLAQALAEYGINASRAPYYL